MLHPNYVELMNVVNKDVEEGEEPVISSRYSIVMATAKRARQIVNGADPLVETTAKEKPLSIAVDELWKDQLQIVGDDAEADEEEAIARLQNGKVASAISEDDLDEKMDANVESEDAVLEAEKAEENSEEESAEDADNKEAQ